MTTSSKVIIGKKEEDLARFCASLANTTRIAILQTLACRNNCEGNIYEVAGLSKFTVGMNLKYLKRYGLIKGSLSSKNISYCIDFEKLDEFKNAFDEFYNKVTVNKQIINSENVPCTSVKII
ncbi:MAG: helix-turn-helix transcriptional regulator [Bacteroidetes bacterium]|nr:helix-turn-helix transcriptional regulator [Bacteroidota bacterium]